MSHFRGLSRDQPFVPSVNILRTMPFVVENSSSTRSQSSSEGCYQTLGSCVTNKSQIKDNTRVNEQQHHSVERIHGFRSYTKSRLLSAQCFSVGDLLALTDEKLHDEGQRTEPLSLNQFDDRNTVIWRLVVPPVPLTLERVVMNKFELHQIIMDYESERLQEEVLKRISVFCRGPSRHTIWAIAGRLCFGPDYQRINRLSNAERRNLGHYPKEKSHRPYSMFKALVTTAKVDTFVSLRAETVQCGPKGYVEAVEQLAFDAENQKLKRNDARSTISVPIFIRYPLKKRSAAIDVAHFRKFLDSLVVMMASGRRVYMHGDESHEGDNRVTLAIAYLLSAIYGFTCEEAVEHLYFQQGAWIDRAAERATESSSRLSSDQLDQLYELASHPTTLAKVKVSTREANNVGESSGRLLHIHNSTSIYVDTSIENELIEQLSHKIVDSCPRHVKNRRNVKNDPKLASKTLERWRLSVQHTKHREIGTSTKMFSTLENLKKSPYNQHVSVPMVKSQGAKAGNTPMIQTLAALTLKRNSIQSPKSARRQLIDSDSRSNTTIEKCENNEPWLVVLN